MTARLILSLTEPEKRITYNVQRRTQQTAGERMVWDHGRGQCGHRNDAKEEHDGRVRNAVWAGVPKPSSRRWSRQLSRDGWMGGW
eukprot:1578404-Rhodomonas_salina.1